MREWTPVAFSNVTALMDGGMTLVCLVEGKRVAVPYLYIQPRSDVRRADDFGTLVLPYWLADELRLPGIVRSATAISATEPNEVEPLHGQ
jgi:hypothetical protein